MIEKITDYCITPKQIDSTYTSVGKNIKTNTLISGASNVVAAIRDVISLSLKSTPKMEILSTLPLEEYFLSDEFLSCLSNSISDFTFKSFICFSSESDSQVSENIKSLHYIFKIAACLGSRYIPYAYYSNDDSAENNISGFTYTLVTDLYSVIVSKSLENAIVFNDKNTIKFFYNKMSEIETFSNKIIDLPDNVGMFDLFFNSTKLLNQTIEYQPSITQYFTMDIIAKYLTITQNRDYVLKKCSFLCSHIQKNFEKNQKYNCTVHFSEEGLKEFALTGYISNVPGQLLAKMDIADRITILQKLKKDIGCYLKMINPMYLNVSPYFSVLGTQNNAVIISYVSERNKFICILKESGLCTAFQKYISTFEEPGFCYPTEYTLSVVDNLIDRLNELL